VLAHIKIVRLAARIHPQIVNDRTDHDPVGHFPSAPLVVAAQDERAFARADQYRTRARGGLEREYISFHCVLLR
jgi:hypothetical protein